MRRVDEPELFDWLIPDPETVNATGVDQSGWEASVWIPHAMYETDELPGGLRMTTSSASNGRRGTGLPPVPFRPGRAAVARDADRLGGRMERTTGAWLVPASLDRPRPASRRQPVRRRSR